MMPRLTPDDRARHAAEHAPVIHFDEGFWPYRPWQKPQPVLCRAAGVMAWTQARARVTCPACLVLLTTGDKKRDGERR